jgi:hypothetical protein
MLLAVALWPAVILAQADSLKARKPAYRYPYTFEVGGTWVKASDISKRFWFAGFWNVNASAVLLQSDWSICLALHAGGIWNQYEPPRGATTSTNFIQNRYYYMASPMIGWSKPISQRSGRLFGLRIGPEYQYRFDNISVYGTPYDFLGGGARYYELGARLEAYGDLVRYKRIFLRGRVAYNLFSIANPRKHPNQAEASLNLGIRLGRKR